MMTDLKLGFEFKCATLLPPHINCWHVTKTLSLGTPTRVNGGSDEGPLCTSTQKYLDWSQSVSRRSRMTSRPDRNDIIPAVTPEEEALERRTTSVSAALTLPSEKPLANASTLQRSAPRTFPAPDTEDKEMLKLNVSSSPPCMFTLSSPKISVDDISIPAI